jgi:hypothetical protein
MLQLLVLCNLDSSLGYAVLLLLLTCAEVDKESRHLLFPHLFTSTMMRKSIGIQNVIFPIHTYQSINLMMKRMKKKEWKTEEFLKETWEIQMLPSFLW